MAEAVDIITTIHQGVWAALNVWQPFKDLVSLSNRVDVTADDFDSFKPNVDASGTPEVVILQGAGTQDAFTVNDAAVGRTQNFSLIVTGGTLGPVRVNRVREQILEGLLNAGHKLGIANTNGNTVKSWSITWVDQMNAVNAVGAGGDAREAFRFQTVATLTVNFIKAVPRRVF